MHTINSFRSFDNNNMVIILMLVIHTAFSIDIGLIRNTAFISSNNGLILSNLTCAQCTCAALITDAVGWNCVKINHTCELIESYSSTDIGLTMSANATFFFQELPPEPSSLTTYAMITGITMANTTTTIPTNSIFSK